MTDNIDKLTNNQLAIIRLTQQAAEVIYSLMMEDGMIEVLVTNHAEKSLNRIPLTTLANELDYYFNQLDFIDSDRIRNLSTFKSCVLFTVLKMEGTHSGEWWDDEERVMARTLLSQGYSPKKIGEIIGRSPAAVRAFRHKNEIPRYKRSWEEDDAELIRLYYEGLKPVQIGGCLDRTYRAVEMRITRLKQAGKIVVNIEA